MKKITILLLTFMLCFTNLSESIPPDIYAQQAEQKHDVQKETVFNGNGFTVKYVIDSIWENQYTANVTITNTGSSTIENWELSYQSADEYSNIWNAEVTYHSARNYMEQITC